MIEKNVVLSQPYSWNESKNNEYQLTLTGIQRPGNLSRAVERWEAQIRRLHERWQQVTSESVNNKTTTKINCLKSKMCIKRDNTMFWYAATVINEFGIAHL